MRIYKNKKIWYWYWHTLSMLGWYILVRNRTWNGKQKIIEKLPYVRQNMIKKGGGKHDSGSFPFFILGKWRRGVALKMPEKAIWVVWIGEKWKPIYRMTICIRKFPVLRNVNSYSSTHLFFLWLLPFEINFKNKEMTHVQNE